MREWSTLRKLMFLKGATGAPLKEYTATGNPLTFQTNKSKPLVSLTVPFTPVQSGSGDPSPTNVRPITGFTGVHVKHLDENLLSINRNSASTVQGITYTPIKQNNTTVAIRVKGTRTGTNPFFNLNYVDASTLSIPVGTYKISGGISGIRLQAFYKDSDGEHSAGFDEGTGATITIPNDAISSWCRLNVFTDNPVDAVIYPIIAASDSTIASVDVTFPALGKNLCNVVASGVRYVANPSAYSYSIANNTVTFNITTAGSNFILLDVVRITSDMVGKKYVFSCTGGSLNDALIYCEDDGSGRHTVTDGIITQDMVGKMLTLRLYPSQSATGEVSYSYIQVEQANSPTSYEPYTSTAYGGSLNLTTGVLTAEWYGVIANGTEQWGYSLTQSGFNRFAINAGTWWGKTAKNSGNVYFSYIKSSSATVEWDGWIGSTGNVLLYGNSELDSVQKWHDYLAEHNLQIVYELATPLTYQLTPAQIQTLIGDNTIWSDTNGSNTAVFYKKG